MAGPRRIAILGGGFSGAAAALHLCRLSPTPLAVQVVEPRDKLGMGVAHGTTERHYRLNGTDGIHSPYPHAPSDFADWLRLSGELDADPEATQANGLVFPRRGAFGRYMEEQVVLAASRNASGSSIDHVRAAATRLGPHGSGYRITLDDGSRLEADYVILALGWNAVGTPGPLAPLQEHPGWIGNPWQTHRLDDLAPDAPVLLIGTGLTACDTFTALLARGHRGPVLALSRRGLRPASQNPYRSSRPVWERILDPDPAILRRHGKPLNVRSAMRLLRREIAAVDPGSSSWHTPFDELRDAVPGFWNEWPLAEQRRYIRHAKPWYDNFRFRNPPQTERLVDAALAEGRLRFQGGRLRGAHCQGNTLRIEYLDRQNGLPHTVAVGAVVNCTGPQPRPGASDNAFWRNLLADGLGRDSPNGLGIDVDGACRLFDARGGAQARIFVIGPPTLGRFGEAIAVPYIVRGILEVARQIIHG
ncbi:MAG: FAD/NAD(P)-binding protein [Pigmentiphaga sp.]|nr:FAD/NAD(P)-binding protein [Pigmentiphaga sp.]